MSLTGFNRARRMVSLETGTPFDELAYAKANEILQNKAFATRQEETIDERMEEEGAPDAEESPEVEGTFRQVREAELQEMSWHQLKSMLEGYDLDTDKPEDSTWAEYAIPMILDYEQESRT